MAEDMQFLGIADEIADVPVKADEPEAFEIWKENRHTVAVFFAMGTQWETNADGVRTGLKYEALPAVERMFPKIPRRKWPRIYNEIRIMEAAALEVIFQKRQEELDRQKQQQ